ncbi:MAG: thioredoxin domain-containing protein [Gammaproteobacteria bacterium]|nr:thioredoxin domain-containing protein [Gammaproteobacteria bacterium]
MHTNLVDENGNPRFTNRLINEDSPYLLQHAHNPVDWYPWGDEAFDRARADDKPVFLSIGYSTCHWCHVMERESFDNEEIAEFLNEHFVCIKLDREQRPDLDDVYMTGVQMMAGQGGWPMSSFLTHEAHPFFAGTYYPPGNFLELLGQLTEVWKTKRADVLKQAEEIGAAIGRHTSAESNVAELSQDLTREAALELVNRLDEVHGGFGGAPKFPNESQLLLLLDDCRRNQSEDSLHTLKLTLDKMYQGGIYDQVAGGFHRYSVDAQWLVPHFEKMLYNQAQLLSVYSQAWTLTGDSAYHRVAMEIGDYVLRDMRAPSGGFYSATDADSDGEEGLFFVWRSEELERVLDAEQFNLVQDVYGVSAGGNFEGSNILNLKTSLESYAISEGIALEGLLARLNEIKLRLYGVREKRVHPLRDEKIISGWNGMMISALAIAANELQIPRFMEAAVAAADMIWDIHVNSLELDLWRVSLQDHTSIPGCLEDYACLTEALLRLYFYRSDAIHMGRGMKLLETMNLRFRDETGGGYFMSAESSVGPMITRPKSPMDGATPSGNSVALRALVMAYQLSGDRQVKQVADEAIIGFSGLIKASPSAFSTMVIAISDLLLGSREKVQFTADGKIRVVLVREATLVTLKIEIAEGWHVNANDVNSDELIATEVIKSSEVVAIDYPASKEMSYTGSVEITVEIATLQYCQIQLRLQACDDHLCLAPELLTFGC